MKSALSGVHTKMVVLSDQSCASLRFTAYGVVGVDGAVEMMV